MFKFIPLIVLAILAAFVIPEIKTLEAQEPKDRPLKVRYQDLNQSARQQVDCLAQNMYFESGWESETGQIAVAMVTINRQESGKYPRTICGVVNQKVASTCQFSWVCESKTTNSINRKVYMQVRALAVHVYANREHITDPSHGAIFYHADYVNPGWRNMVYLTKIGRHKFYNRKDV